MANKKHPHAEVIKAYVDGQTVQRRFVVNGEGTWSDVSLEWMPEFLPSVEYRIKPDQQEREYPKTQMNEKYINEAIRDLPGTVVRNTAYTIANAALRHACDNGQIVTRAEFDRAVGDRQKRDWMIALATRDACRGQLEKEYVTPDIAGVIAEVNKLK